MKRMDLSGSWLLSGNGYNCSGTVPGSVYSFLLEAGLMEDPFFRDNEDAALALMEHNYTFTRNFHYTLSGNPVKLCCDGLDTLATVLLNGQEVAKTQNMHRRYEFDVTALLADGENEIAIRFESPTAYVRERHAEDPIPGVSQWPYHGFYHLRKVHSMFGWDWGPRLPDAGIWRDIYLLEENSARILKTHVRQRHENGRVFLFAEVETSGKCALEAEITDPAGIVRSILCNTETEIAEPQLWWPNGLGAQPLYTVTIRALERGKVVDSVVKRIGLRTLKLIRQRDIYGEGLWHEVNGVAFFAVGANYIPEDNIFSRITKERSRWLLQQAKDCNFNTLRVWGGGYYPADWFYDLCDEMGLVVFQDMMVACCMLPDRQEIREEMEAEVRDNLMRIRHHACLGLIAGNNEVEGMFVPERKSISDGVRQGYLEIFEHRIPNAIAELCPEIGYIPCSPSTCGHFIDPENENYGDSHYWEVWHKNKPYDEYRKHFFRYMSEFGFQSFPCEKTVDAFALPKDKNVFSRVMERHQRRPAENGKILSYMSQTFLYPTDFGVMLYSSQVMQAIAMKYCAEHLRRHRGRCMGALYWQFNDIWPGASWSSIDYFGRYKALQYAAKRFYAPVMISCEEVGETATRKDVNKQKDFYDYETTARLCVHNETRTSIDGTVHWCLCSADSKILQEGKQTVTVTPMSVVWLDKLDFQKTDVLQNHLTYWLEMEGQTVSEGSVLFTAPKHYEYVDPQLSCEIQGDEITVYAKSYAQYVQIDSPDSDFILSDNYFDMEKGHKTVKILSGTPKTIQLRSVYDIR